MAKKKRKRKKKRDVGQDQMDKARGVAMMQDSLLGSPRPDDVYGQEERKTNELIAFMNIFHPKQAPKNWHEARQMRK